MHASDPDPGDADALARALLRHADAATPWPDALRAALPAELDAAYALALRVRELRIARGERPVGFKIGFTNRTIWARYQVFAPIWGTVWDTTLADLTTDGDVDLTGLCEPRLEPEVVFGLAATPPAEPSLQQLFDAIDWIAPGFEIVQTHCPQWRFSAAETVADGGLHGRLLVGRRRALRDVAADAQALTNALAPLHVTLQRDGRDVDTGTGTNVLDGPLHALRHFVRERSRCAGAPALRRGDVVTTGTWTDAWPLAPGGRWRAAFDAPLGDVELRLRG